MTALAAPHGLGSALNVLDAHSLLRSFGTLGIFVILLLETGLLIGIVLPGDSLLFTAGLLSATAGKNALHLSLPAVLIAAVAGALLGAQIGYLLGRRLGPALVTRSRRPRVAAAIHRTQELLNTYGPAKAIVLGRFIPFIRTLVNPLAGAVGIRTRTFTAAQVAGGVVWSIGVPLAGYTLGQHIPSIDRYLLPIVAVIVAVSLVPVLLEVRRQRHRAATMPRGPGA
jgi:membrane-associated protein